MDKGIALALVLVAIGGALIIIGLSSISTDVVVNESLTVTERRIFLGPYQLPRGYYSVWLEDFREGDELGQWNAYLLTAEEDMRWGDWPDEVERRTHDGVEAERTHVLGTVPAGEYTLVLECHLEEVNGTTLRVLLVDSTEPLVEAGIGVGGILIFLAVIVVVLTRRRRAQGP